MNHSSQPVHRKLFLDATAPPTASKNIVIPEFNASTFCNIDGLRCLYTNADSLKNKLIEFQTIVRNLNPDIMAISEVYPKNYRFVLENSELQIQGYDIFRSPQDSDHRGCALYIKQHLGAKRILVDTIHKDAVWCEIKLLNNDVLLLGCVYRHHCRVRESSASHQNFIKMLNDYVQNKNYSHVLITGDFNLKHIDWNNWSSPSSNMKEEGNTFLEWMRDNFLYQHVDTPTRGRDNQKSNILDLIITNEENMVTDLEHLSPLGKSDHELLYFRFNSYVTRNPSFQSKLCYDKGNYDKMRSDLSLIDWQTELNSFDNVDDQWNFFRQKIIDTTTLHVPKRKPPKFNTNQPGIFNEKILKSIRKKHRAWQRYMETKDGEKYIEYCRVRNKVKTMTRQAKIKLEKSISDQAKTNPKSFWKYTKSKLKTKDNIPDLDIPNTNNITTKNDQEKADVFQKFFSSVFIKDTDNSHPLPNITIRTATHMEKIYISESDVKKKLEILKVNKSPGPDNIHPRILFELRENIAKPLTTIFNTSILTRKIPQEWKDAHVSSIFKKGNRQKPNNYRPVSLTCISCKILESIVKDHIVLHMKRNNLFSKSQFGFLKGRSTTYQLLIAIDKWTEILDSGGNVDTIYFDFMKAFDTVSHVKLLQKLPAYGFNKEMIDWIGSFLEDRRQRVIVNGTESSWGDVTSGIPQGSILGPLLFVIFINDLPDVTNSSSILLFADDTKLYSNIGDIQDQKLMQTDVNNMAEWSKTWSLKFHPDKCKVMRFCKKIDLYIP